MKAIIQSPKLELPPALQFLSTLEVAIILGVSRKLVNGWVNDGKLPAFRMGADKRVIRVRRQDLEDFISQNTTLNITANEH